MPGHFLDTSIYRVLNVNETLLKQPDVDGIVHRASVGANYTDPSLLQMYGDTKLIGLLFGAYLVTNPLYTPASHVTNFLKVAGELTLDYAPIVDAELHAGMSRSAVTNHLVETYQLLWNAMGVEPVIYSAAWFLNSYVDMTHPVLKAAKWWIASYPSGLKTFEDAEAHQNWMVMPSGLVTANVIAWQFSSTFAPIVLDTGAVYSCDANLGYSFGFERDWSVDGPLEPVEPGTDFVQTIYSLYFRSGHGTSYPVVGGTAPNQRFVAHQIKLVPNGVNWDVWARVSATGSPVEAWVAVELWSSGKSKTYSILL